MHKKQPAKKSKSYPTSFRLSEEALLALEEMSIKFGVNKSVVVEVLIRDKARKEKLL
jgi:hypothetical protein